MLIAWGTFSLQHPRATAAPERCASCNQDAVERRTIERTSHFMAIPIVPRAWRTAARCTHCKRLDVEKLAPAAAPRRKFAPRVWLSWALIAIAVGAGIFGEIAKSRLAHERAAAPEVGDEWTIRTARWPGLPGGMLAYARARIDTIEHGVVTADACDYTATTDDTIESKCKQYPIEMAPIDLAEVPKLVDAGAITSIWRGGDPMAPHFAVMGVCLGIALVAGLLAWRSSKRSFKADDPIPRAAIA